MQVSPRSQWTAATDVSKRIIVINACIIFIRVASICCDATSAAVVSLSSNWHLNGLRLRSVCVYSWIYVNVFMCVLVRRRFAFYRRPPIQSIAPYLSEAQTCTFAADADAAADQSLAHIISLKRYIKTPLWSPQYFTGSRDGWTRRGYEWYDANITGP